MRKVMTTLIVLVCLSVLVSCNKNTNSTKTYTISFASDNGQTFESVTINGQSMITLPTPSKEGYAFDGWYSNQKYQNGTEVTNSTVIGKNITLYAKWMPLDIVVSFDLDGGSFVSDAPLSQTIKTNELPTLSRVTKDGYLFLGYSHNGELIDNNTYFTHDVTLKAEYLSREQLQDTYNLQLNLNGGAFYNLNVDEEDYIMYYYNVEDQLTRSIGTSTGIASWQIYYNCFTILQNHLIGYDAYFGNLDNWNNWRWLMMYLASLADTEASNYLYILATTNYEQLATSYQEEQYAILNELAGFLQFSKKTNTVDDKTYISFDYDTILYTDSLATFMYRDTYDIGEDTFLPIPIRDGYEFMGWFDNEELNGTPIFKIQYNEYGDKTYYAKWQKQ